MAGKPPSGAFSTFVGDIVLATEDVGATTNEGGEAPANDTAVKAPVEKGKPKGKPTAAAAAAAAAGEGAPVTGPTPETAWPGLGSLKLVKTACGDECATSGKPPAPPAPPDIPGNCKQRRRDIHELFSWLYFRCE
jgi:hypothetical protein